MIPSNLGSQFATFGDNVPAFTNIRMLRRVFDRNPKQ
jgi:hypothetical protein